MEEEWKDIEGFEGSYQVSNIGKVRSLNREVFHSRYGKQTIKSRLMSLVPTKDGYLRVTLKRGSRGKFLIHRLIAQLFIPNPENKPQVNHINGVKTDNRIENLEWCSSSENISHSYRIKLRVGNGENNNFSKLTDDVVRKIRNEYKGMSLSKIAEICGVSKTAIHSVKNGKTWKHL